LVKRRNDFEEKFGYILQQACSSPQARARLKSDMSGFDSPSAFIAVHRALEAIDRNCSRVDRQIRAELESEALAIDDATAFLEKEREVFDRHRKLRFGPESVLASPSPSETDKVATTAEEDARQERAIQAAETQAQAMDRQATAAERQAKAEEQRAQADFLNAFEPSPLAPLPTPDAHFHFCRFQYKCQCTVAFLSHLCRNRQKSRQTPAAVKKR